MKIYDKTIKNLYPIQKIDEIDKKSIFCFYLYLDDFIKKDNVIYHKRQLEIKYLINELINELISEYFNIKTVNSILYKVNNINSKYCLLTKLFTNSENKYSDMLELFPKFYEAKNSLDNYLILNNLNEFFNKEDNKNYKLKNKNREKLILDIKTMIIRDFITNTTDRHIDNFMFYYDQNNVELMPLYDYEYSFLDGDEVGNYFELDFNNEKILEILRNDETYQILLEKSMLLEIKNIIKNLEERYPIKLSSKDKMKYENVIIKNKEKIKEYKLIK